MCATALATLRLATRCDFSNVVSSQRATLSDVSLTMVIVVVIVTLFEIRCHFGNCLKCRLV